MDVYRKKYISDLRLELTRLKKVQERETQVFAGLPRLGLPESVLLIKQSELKDNLDRRESETVLLSEKIRAVEDGAYDVEIGKTIEVAKVNQKNSRIVIDGIKTKGCEDRRLNEEFYKKDRKRTTEDRFATKDLNYHYNRFCDISDTVPEYMRNNLSEMPNNKGYIWRGCWFFGSRPPENRQPVVVFEKKGPVMRIHEMDKKEYCIYEKRGKEKKVLVSRKMKKVWKGI
jgi:hypothetical protein